MSSTLLSIQSLSKSYGTQTLFERLSLSISKNDRMGLVGPNGAGKTTLLKIIMNLEDSDEGEIIRRQNLNIGYASQAPEFPDTSVEDVLLENVPSGEEEQRLTKARILLGKAQFCDFSVSAKTLSGGWKKRLDIIRALCQEPDLLILDEPTNHLDLEGILWLEQFLQKEHPSYIIVSHDRYFLNTVCNQVVELNRCYPKGLFASDGNMDQFYERRNDFLESQKQMERGLASKVREEAAWLLRSPKARTTKARSRVEKAEQQIEELATIKKRNTVTTVDIAFSASERATRKLLASKNVGKAFESKQIFKGIDLVLSPNSRLGLVGKNGAGKTTLLKTLSGAIAHDSGTIKYADDLKIVYFDQHRQELPGHLTLCEALSPRGDFVEFRGQSIHVNGWARKFLFSQDRLKLPISCLSGGERARIQIATLMLQHADILFLDEPTNDLDIATLEVIEENLIDFPGAVVLISHDRCFMDRVCSQILGLEEDGSHHFFADYNQYERYIAEKKPSFQKKEPQPVKPIPLSKKLTYKEQKELEGMEESIAQTE